MKQIKVPAVYMRGGSSKGIFFLADDVPLAGPARDAFMLRVIGSPDPYGKQIDGMGGATSSTSKVVVIKKSNREDSDVDYLFGAPAIENPVVDWSGNCGNLSSAVGPFAIRHGLVKVPENGVATVRIWQENIQKQIIAHVPMKNGEVQEYGDFVLDGVAFPAAEIILEFMQPGGVEEGILPTGNAIDYIDIPDFKKVEVTLLNAGNPTIFIGANQLELDGTETQAAVNGNSRLLELIEKIRAHCTVAMGFAKTPDEATKFRPHTPKICLIAEPSDYQAAGGKQVSKEQIDVIARIISMGKLHHAITGTGAIAVAVAACLDGTLVNKIVGDIGSRQVRIGHTAGTVNVGAQTECVNGQWIVEKAIMSRSARIIMDGYVYIPEVVSS
ncbi:2-methylaconitate cis-trans isomerase PrpF [Acinetobacter pittii]|uniref:2-methylaconitate cis-trans isomerase PrpF n=1 Tax=Acinetobacter pittii TaxID=48296 RepID=UPI003AF5C4ED